MTLEKKIETSILDWLNLQPECFAFKINTGGIFDPKSRRFRKNSNPHCHNGTSDIIGSWRGKMLAIEVKREKSVYGPKTYPSREQKEFLTRIEQAGGIAFVARSLEEVKKNLSPDIFGSINDPAQRTHE